MSDHVERNRAAWDADSAAYQARHAGDLEASSGKGWGVWHLPEAGLDVLGDVRDCDVLELGCGGAQWSIALALDGARVTGLDASARQLAYARERMAAAGLEFPLVHASAEDVPLPDAAFDVVFCDHGAMGFADPDRTVPEVARLLRPGGLLAFCLHTAFVEAHWPLDAPGPGERLVRDVFGMRAFEADDGMVSFMLSDGEWIAVLHRHGLQVQDLIELRPPPDATSSYCDAADLAWARRWPMEVVWRARRV